MERKKKAGAMLGVLYLLAVLCFPGQVLASEQSATLTAEVPAVHSVRLEIGSHGTVMVNGNAYSGTQTIQVERQKEQEYLLQAEEGWRIAAVTYGPEGQAAEVTPVDSVFAAPALCEDGMVLSVTLEEDPDGQGTEPAEDPEDTEGSPTPSEEPSERGVNTGQADGNGGDGAKGTASKAVQTGDESRLVWWGTILILSLAGMAAVAKRKLR